ncbi:hypothetical protein CC80DRAFT_548145 [Byssothecium circinans]|uniref:Uncharacterized protein n=1 Tax=Byssothecium circinans TaxID=147558 RepID=A0A6A5TX59_9PLEO|nr:hypothetical protein CC80DRAFT_548145 [Byssothecium circinans]
MKYLFVLLFAVLAAALTPEPSHDGAGTAGVCPADCETTYNTCLHRQSEEFCLDTVCFFGHNKCYDCPFCAPADPPVSSAALSKKWNCDFGCSYSCNYGCSDLIRNCNGDRGCLKSNVCSLKKCSKCQPCLAALTADDKASTQDEVSVVLEKRFICNFGCTKAIHQCKDKACLVNVCNIRRVNEDIPALAEDETPANEESSDGLIERALCTTSCANQIKKCQGNKDCQQRVCEQQNDCRVCPMGLPDEPADVSEVAYCGLECKQRFKKCRGDKTCEQNVCKSDRCPGCRFCVTGQTGDHADDDNDTAIPASLERRQDIVDAGPSPEFCFQMCERKIARCGGTPECHNAICATRRCSPCDICKQEQAAIGEKRDVDEVNSIGLKCPEGCDSMVNRCADLACTHDICKSSCQVCSSCKAYTELSSAVELLHLVE